MSEFKFYEEEISEETIAELAKMGIMRYEGTESEKAMVAYWEAKWEKERREEMEKGEVKVSFWEGVREMIFGGIDPACFGELVGIGVRSYKVARENGLTVRKALLATWRVRVLMSSYQSVTLALRNAKIWFYGIAVCLVEVIL